VKGQTIASHGFVLASRSAKCYQLLCENKENCPEVTDRRIRTIHIPQHNNVDYNQVVSWLKRLYGGGNTNDEELFLKDVPPSESKNGYNSISKDKIQKKLSQTDKSLKEKKVVREFDDKLVQDCSLADLVFLSKRELDDFSAPSVDNSDMLLEDNAAGNLMEMSTCTLDAAKIKQRKTIASKNPVR